MNWDRPGFLKQGKPFTSEDLDDQDRRLISGALDASVDKQDALVDELKDVAEEVALQFKQAWQPNLAETERELYDHRAFARMAYFYKRRVVKRRGDSELSPNGADVIETAKLKALLRQGAQDLFEYHIGTYRNMFKEINQRKPAMEVYIGRDSVFMYAARKAYLWGRGENARNVKYLGFPKEFTVPEGDPWILRDYLRDNGISTAKEALYIDTGFFGAVPEYILRKIFHMSDETEIDKRIFMIASKNPHRQLKALPDELKAKGNEVVAARIEKAPKPTDRIKGLYTHSHTKKLMSYGDTSLPEDILAHEFMKYLCMRHFYLQGRAEQNAAK